MDKLKTITWLCQKEGAPYQVTGKGSNVTDAFNLLPKYRKIEAVHGLVGIEINGVKQ